MKRVWLVVGLGLALALGSVAGVCAKTSKTAKATKAVTEDEADYQNNLTINPFGFVISTLYAQYEYTLTSKNTVAILATAGGYTSGGWSFSDFGIGGSYRWYFGDENAPRGWFWGPIAGIDFVSSTYKDAYGFTSSVSSPFFTVGADIGYKWIWGDNKMGFVLCPSFGLGYQIGSISVNGVTAPYGGFWPRFGLNAGIAF